MEFNGYEGRRRHHHKGWLSRLLKSLKVREAIVSFEKQTEVWLPDSGDQACSVIGNFTPGGLSRTIGNLTPSCAAPAKAALWLVPKKAALWATSLRIMMGLSPVQPPEVKHAGL